MALCLALALALALALPSAAQSVVGRVGTEEIREADVIAADRADFDRLEEAHELERNELEMKFAKSRHDMLQQRLDALLDRRALELEAAKRGTTTDAVLADLKMDIPSEAESRTFYDANRDRIRQPYEEVAQQVHDYLTKQRNQESTRRFYDGLRAKHGISTNLEPFRIAVAATGPARGRGDAPVTIVEFGDFQCPYCKQAESSLRTIMERHPREVRVVFRNLPLTQIHPDAQLAAQAAVCAGRQGKFWAMHDALYDDQSALKRPGLESTAKRIGLDGRRFADCLTDAGTRESLADDAQAARELGLAGTPFFFINGRPLDGNVPMETMERIIDEELHQAPEHRS